MADEDFRHDLIIATEDGAVFHIPNGEWNKEGYKVKRDDYEQDGWMLCASCCNAVPM